MPTLNDLDGDLAPLEETPIGETLSGVEARKLLGGAWGASDQELLVWIAEGRLTRLQRLADGRLVKAEVAHFPFQMAGLVEPYQLLNAWRFIRAEVESFDPTQNQDSWNPSGRFATHQQALGYLGKTLPEAEAADRLKAWLWQGDLIGYQNGALVHAAILAVLPIETAKQFCLEAMVFPEGPLIELARQHLGLNYDSQDAITGGLAGHHNKPGPRGRIDSTESGRALATQKAKIAEISKKLVREAAQPLIRRGRLNHAEIARQFSPADYPKLSKILIRSEVKALCIELGQTRLILGHPDYQKPR